MSISFEYDDAAAGNADREPMTTGPYIVKFTCVSPVETDAGAEGLEFEFDAPGRGTGQFTVYTKSKEGKQTFGYNQVMALMYLLGAKSLKSKPGKVNAWVDGTNGKREKAEVDGERFFDLEDKPIGVVLQKEHTTKKAGGDSYRWNLVGQYDPTTKLTASELKERVTKPEKLDKILKGLKDKDSRKNGNAEPAQPSLGAGVEGF